MPRATKKTQQQSKGVDTRTRVIQAAARHFAEHGFRGTSQRAIQRELGVNPATVSYHFGSKRELYRAVVDTYIHGVQEQRLERLARIEDSLTGSDRLYRLLYDYFYPHLQLAATPDGHAYARLLAQVQGDTSDSIAGKIFTATVSPVRRRYLAELQKLFPDAPRQELMNVLIMGVALMAIVSNWGTEKRSKPEALAHHYADQLARYAAAGFEALLGPAAGASARASRRKVVSVAA